MPLLAELVSDRAGFHYKHGAPDRACFGWGRFTLVLHALRPRRCDHAVKPVRAVGHRGIGHLRRAVRGLGWHIGQLVPEARRQVGAEKDRVGQIGGGWEAEFNAIRCDLGA